MRMIEAAARAAQEEFDSDAARVESLLTFLESFRSYAAQRDPEPELVENSERSAAGRLWSQASEVRTDLPVLAGSLLLYLCGRFENFVRELAGSVVEDLVDSTAKYVDLPPALKKEHLSRVLAINQSPGRYGYDPDAAAALAVEWAHGFSSGDSGFSVTTDVITITESNMNPGTLTDVLKRVGVGEVWETLGKQASVKLHLSEVRDGDCTRMAKIKLEALMKERNKIAHPTKDTEFPDAGYVRSAAEYFRVLAKELLNIVLVLRAAAN